MSSNQNIEHVYSIACAAGLDWSCEQFKEHAALLHTHYIIEENGFVALSIVGDEAEIINIAVLPEYQNQGVGKTLWYKVKQLFVNRGVARCFLEVRQSNINAQLFYQAIGFKQIAVRRRYYQHPIEDAFIFCWEKS